VTWLKACVVLLALANAGYFLWARGVGSPEPADGAALPAAAPSLRLVSEGPGTPGLPAAPMPAAGPAGSQGAAPDASGAPTLAPIPAPASVDAAATPGGQDLRPAAPGAAPLTAAKRCITVGPFADVSAAFHAAATLRAAGYTPRERIAEGEQARDAPAQQLGLDSGIADRTSAGNVYWVDVDLKPTDGLVNPADLQAESGRIVRLEVKPCPRPTQTP